MLADKKCMAWLTENCMEATSGMEVCGHFWDTVKEKCKGDGPDKEMACKYAQQMGMKLEESTEEKSTEEESTESTEEKIEEPREEEEEPPPAEESERRESSEIKADTPRIPMAKPEPATMPTYGPPSRRELAGPPPRRVSGDSSAARNNNAAPAPGAFAAPAAAPFPAPGLGPYPAPAPIPAAAPYGAGPDLICKDGDCLPPCERQHLDQKDPACHGVPSHKDFKMGHMDKSLPEAGLPEQGMDEFSGRLVSHEDQETQVDDWQQEWPQADESEGMTKEKMCKENPKNGWCKLYLAHRERKKAMEQPPPTQAPWLWR